ncbi:MAG: tRNA (N6-isopentenyl adenosine(37)-C2)-methylthiotransferase MiaB [Fidelibacterota bacterium]|nr:MAG: tRNA (N6-isopentenyl adenosine(37)-C2)-methylthiotransferase MiaB [Candidatus Neomarinimicrobiota bacterium]
MRYFIETYGCQMNVADSELVAGLLDGSGHRRATRLEDAQIILFNTCAIREKAEKTIHNRLSQLARLKENDPSILIGVLGCMAKHLSDDLLESKPYVDMVLGPDSYRRLPQLVQDRKAEQEHIVDTRLSRFEVYDDMFPSRREGVNAWTSIMRGCDKFCTFCVVPFTRGRERSRSVAGIVAEVEEAVRQGFVEVTLLGQNVNSYQYEGTRFPDLLESVAAVPGVRRIRYTSPHPSDMDDRLLDVMVAHDNICESIHLPLQAGSDRILRRMNRSYTRSEYIRLVERIRAVMPECTISTDIIVGFPGEQDVEFQETLQVVEQLGFDSAFTFKYSIRPGTKAAEYEDQVPDEVKQERLEQLIAVQKAITLVRNRTYVGREVEVLVEKESKKSSLQWAGRTDGNKWVVFDKESARIKDFVKVHIDTSHGVALQGHIINAVDLSCQEAYHAVG